MLNDDTKRRAARRWLFAAPVLLVLATCAVFYGAGRGEFLTWDDDINITGNPRVQALTGENLRWMFTDTEYVRRYMPLGWLAFASQWAVFGPGPRSFHAGNVLIHALSAVLLFFILRRLLRLVVPVDERDDKERVVVICAGLAALLWAAHPLRVEPVAWASGRLYCQAIFFLLCALLGYLRYSESAAAGRPSRAWYWTSVGAYAASLLTYPLALGFVAVLLLIDLYPLRRWGGGLAGLRSAAARQALLEKAPYVAVVGLIFAVTLWARSTATGLWRPPTTLSEFGLLSRVMQGFYVWASYLWRSAAPQDLSPVYTTLVEFDPLGAPFVLSFLAVAGISAVVAWRWRQWPGLVVGWACYLLILVPMLGLTEHPHYVNDRYSYLPAIALAALVAGLLFQLSQVRRARVVSFVAAGGAAVVLSLMSVAQVRAWRDTDTLFLHIIAKMGDSPYRADTYCRLGNRRLRQDRPGEAQQFFTEATRVAPAFVPAYRGLGEALLRQGRVQEAADIHLKAISLRRPTPDLLVNTAEALAAAGRYEAAVQHYRAALEAAPAYGQAMNGLAWLLATCPEDRLRDGAQAVKLAGTVADGTGHQMPQVEITLAAAHAEAGDFPQALKAAELAQTLAAPSGDSNLIARCTQVLEAVRRGKPFREAPVKPDTAARDAGSNP